MSGITIVMLIVYAVVFGGGSIFLVAKSMSKKNNTKGEIVENKQSDGFGSRIGFILSTIGIAVGVGAMWRFPNDVRTMGRRSLCTGIHHSLCRNRDSCGLGRNRLWQTLQKKAP